MSLLRARFTTHFKAWLIAAALGPLALMAQSVPAPGTPPVLRGSTLEGKAFDLRRFHDFLWLNGNVPIALQKEEYLAMVGGQ
jgi:hypothetical protein